MIPSFSSGAEGDKMNGLLILKKNSIQVILLLFAFFTLLNGEVFSQASEEDRIIKAIESAKVSVVNIQAAGVRPGGGSFTETGSGIVMKENGFILTNNHVVKDARDITVTIYNGKKFHGIVAGRAPKEDLALIKINASGLRVPEWGNSKTLKIGQVAIAIGNPYKFDWSVSRGIISNTNRRIPAPGILYQEMIQTDAAINPGSSGGALIDSHGRVIGINTLIYTGTRSHSAQGLGFAIPIHKALEVSSMLLSKKVLYDPQPWIGINGMDVTPQMAERSLLPVRRGVLITQIHPVSPAERGGLLKGDIVVEVNNSLVRTIAEFQKILSSSQPGDNLIIGVWRGNKKLTINVQVAQRSAQQ